MLSKNPNAVSLSVAIALALATAHVAAAPDSDHGSTGSPRTESSDTKRGPTVEVTARRESTAIDASLAAVRVIDRAEIERRQAGDLMELLRTEAGVDITRSGGVGQATTLFLRGSNSNHTLFLIDGVRVASANSGLYDLAHLPLANVERIEIVRGPRAAFWGSDAIGGVVQIFTRKVEGYAGRVMAGKYGRLGVDAKVFRHLITLAGIAGIDNECEANALRDLVFSPTLVSRRYLPAADCTKKSETVPQRRNSSHSRDRPLPAHGFDCQQDRLLCSTGCVCHGFNSRRNS